VQHSIIRLANHYQHYDWGTDKEIAELLNVETPEDQGPLAELWIGAHPRLPSYSPQYGMYLNELLRANPQLLSKHDRNGQLPFLLKLISADKPLSLQVHPSKEQAERGFERENASEKPLDATNRNYRDANHKPEMLYALTPFSAMVGFRDAIEIAKLLEQTQEKNLVAWSHRLKENSSVTTTKELFIWLLSLSEGEVRTILDDVIKYTPTFSNQAYYWLNQLFKFYSYDIGILFPLILNLVQLQPGEAIFLGAGCPHAYLRGSGIEIMANSDNVLRGGLTSKHVDREELTSVVNFDRATNKVAYVECIPFENEKIFTVPCDDFSFSIIELTDERPFQRRESASAELYLVLRGHCIIDDTSFKSGDAFLIPAGVHTVYFEGCSTVVRVKSNLLQ